MSNSIKTDPVLYLSHLQQQNNLKRQREALEEEKGAERKSRETGFELFFKGANVERLRSTSTQFQAQNKRNLQQTQSPVRKKWNLPSVPVTLSPYPESPATPSPPTHHSRASLSEIPDAATILDKYSQLVPGDRRKVLAFLKKLESENG